MTSDRLTGLPEVLVDKRNRIPVTRASVCPGLLTWIKTTDPGLSETLCPEVKLSGNAPLPIQTWAVMGITMLEATSIAGPPFWTVEAAKKRVSAAFWTAAIKGLSVVAFASEVKICR